MSQCLSIAGKIEKSPNEWNGSNMESLNVLTWSDAHFSVLWTDWTRQHRHFPPLFSPVGFCIWKRRIFHQLVLTIKRICGKSAIFAVLWIQCQFNPLDFLCHFVYFSRYKLFFLNKFSCATIDMQTSTEERSSFYMHFNAVAAIYQLMQHILLDLH